MTLESATYANRVACEVQQHDDDDDDDDRDNDNDKFVRTRTRDRHSLSRTYRSHVSRNKKFKRPVAVQRGLSKLRCETGSAG